MFHSEFRRFYGLQCNLFWFGRNVNLRYRRATPMAKLSVGEQLVVTLGA